MATPQTLQSTQQSCLQAEDDLDQQEWMEAIQGVTACLLNGDVDIEALSRAQPKPARPTHSRQGSRAGTAPLLCPMCVPCDCGTCTWGPSHTHRHVYVPQSHGAHLIHTDKNSRAAKGVDQVCTTFRQCVSWLTFIAMLFAICPS